MSRRAVAPARSEMRGVRWEGSSGSLSFYRGALGTITWSTSQETAARSKAGTETRCKTPGGDRVAAGEGALEPVVMRAGPLCLQEAPDLVFRGPQLFQQFRRRSMSGESDTAGLIQLHVDAGHVEASQQFEGRCAHRSMLQESSVPVGSREEESKAANLSIEGFWPPLIFRL